MAQYVLARENIAGITLTSAMLLSKEEAEHRVRAAQAEEDAAFDAQMWGEALRWKYFVAEVVRS